MSEPEQGPSTLHFIVPSTDGGQLLIQSPADSSSELRLPERLIQAVEDSLEPELAAAADLLGPAVPVLRIAPIDLTWDHAATDIVIETEPIAVDALPDGHAWRRIDDVRPAFLAREAVRPALERWLEEHRSGEPNPKRPVWARRGFTARAAAWMAAELEAAGTPLLGPPRLTQLWGIAAFLQGETAAGRVFLKSCAAVFAAEPQITRALDQAYPRLVPSVVAIEPEQRWLLMRDVGGEPLGKAPVERWADGLALFGSLQREWPEASARLSKANRVELEDRSPGRLPAGLPSLLEDPRLNGLSDVERARALAELPRFIEGCDRIAQLGPPATLVHGDLHPWNFHLDGDRISIIDWSDGCMGHPFFDLPTFVGRTRDVARRRAMLDAYLDGWSEGYERAALEEAAQLGLLLGSLHQVESYRRIVESLEPEDIWDLDMGLTSWVQRAIRFLDMGLEATYDD